MKITSADYWTREEQWRGYSPLIFIAEDDIKARDILHAQGPRTAALYDPEVTRVHEHHLGQGTDVVATHTHLAAEVEEEGKEEETTTAVAPEADTIDTLGSDLRLLDVEQDRVPESGG